MRNWEALHRDAMRLAGAGRVAKCNCMGRLAKDLYANAATFEYWATLFATDESLEVYVNLRVSTVRLIRDAGEPETAARWLKAFVNGCNSVAVRDRIVALTTENVVSDARNEGT